jgi:hypothetical protein
MLTVSLGDLYPISTIGRWITILAALFGYLILGIIMSSFFSLIQMNRDSERQLIKLEENENEVRLSETAVKVLQGYCRYFLYRENGKIASQNDIKENDRIDNNQLNSRKGFRISIKFGCKKSMEVKVRVKLERVIFRKPRILNKQDIAEICCNSYRLYSFSHREDFLKCLNSFKIKKNFEEIEIAYERLSKASGNIKEIGKKSIVITDLLKIMEKIKEKQEIIERNADLINNLLSCISK